MDRNSQGTPRGRPVSSLDAAKANDLFEHFITAATLKVILGTHRAIFDCLHLKPNVFPHVYPKLRSNLNSWKAKAVWKKLDARASHKCYGRGKICSNTRVLIIGAGPCGLRTAIEAQLLGAKVVIIEKRDRISRNNVLHLWPFVIEDLRALGAKKFFGKFCAGAIDHISIRQLQCILLKVALLLGVEIHTELSFEGLIEPNNDDKVGWRAKFKPSDHPVSQYEFDVIVGADGKRNTLQGFNRKEFRGKLAIAITANFINKRTEAEARVQEISGVAFIFNQKFFKDLNAETKIDLENIVYYKDDTHYFVMTAKKNSLLDKGVIKQDYADTERLLAPENVEKQQLMNYAKEAADFSTNYQMPNLEFAVNHYGQPDVAMFDFTSMYAAENASKVFERNGHKLLMILVGDSLLEPFWPTGSGCARGFLSALDACWAIKGWGSGIMTPLEVLSERESIYRLLAQTTPENLNKDWKSYTLDPSTRYPNLNKSALAPPQVISLYDSDDPKTIELTSRALESIPLEHHRKRRKREIQVDPDTLLAWIKEQVREHTDLEVDNVATCFRDGRVLCAIIHHYRPDLLDYSQIDKDEAAKNNQLAFDLLEKEIGITPVMTGEEMVQADYLSIFSYLTQIYQVFRVEIPHIKHPKLDLPDIKETVREFPKFPRKIGTLNSVESTPKPASVSVHSRSKRHVEVPFPRPFVVHEPKKSKKRRSLENHGANLEERLKRLEEISTNRAERQNKRRQQRKLQTQQFIKSMQMLQANAKPDHSEPFEDYSIFVYRQTAPHFQDRVKDLEKKFTYVPDHESRLPSKTRTGGDGEFVARIKGLQEKWHEPTATDKKPKDLMRAIGKIETTDWNIKEIEKKILENKMGKSFNKEREKVPKWNREQFLARHSKMEKKQYNRQDSSDAKFSELDRGIKRLEQKLKEGTIRELGTNKVASITEKLLPKGTEVQSKPLLVKTNVKSTMALPVQGGGSEYCHFCLKRVYLMERLSAEGKFFHRGCFKCQYCHTTLRLGSYLFDKDGQNRFYCSQHFGMAGELRIVKVNRRDLYKSREVEKEEDPYLTPTAGVDLLDRVRTPERIEYSNLSAGNLSSDHDESLSQMDEDEWTDKNFGASAAEACSSDEEESCSLSGSESDNEEGFEEALEEPATKEGTMKWMERCKQRYSKDNALDDSDSEEDVSSSNPSSYYENSSEDDGEDEPATEGEEEIRARELRKQEVQVEPPILHTDTGSDTEVVSDESSTESSRRNSATEVSTDSEFALDETPTREKRYIFDDSRVTKTRGSSGTHTRKVQVKSGTLQVPSGGKDVGEKRGVKLEITPLALSQPKVTQQPSLLSINRAEGYALNRTQSTGGIATKVSLELKKRYLLGDSSSGNIQKSGSVSTLDSKFKSFHTNISDCQKLLRPALSKTDGGTSPDLVKPNAQQNLDRQPDVTICNETEGRPRSPLQEIPILIPDVSWAAKNDANMSSDSLTSSSDSDDSKLEQSPGKIFTNIPRVEVHNDEGKIVDAEEDLPMDSLVCAVKETDSKSEKKSLNQPKELPGLRNECVRLHESEKNTASDLDSVTAVLTETEQSDWAHDSAVSDDFEIFELEEQQQRPKVPDLKSQQVTDNAFSLNNCLSNIEFMDTAGEEIEPVEATNKIDITEDSLNPNINDICETINPHIAEHHNFGAQVVDLKPIDLKILKEKQTLLENEEDSLIIVETGTSTEDTFTSSTVKNADNIKDEFLENLRRDQKQLQLKVDRFLAESANNNEQNTRDYVEHCQRLQSRVDFGNLRDSIDVRKSKHKDKSESGDPALPLVRQPTAIYSKECIRKERDENQKLIQEIVMNKMKAQNKTLERKRRSRNFVNASLSPNFDLNKSHSLNNNSTPDVLLTGTQNLTLDNDKGNVTSVNRSELTPLTKCKAEDTKKTAEKMKQEARSRARLKSNRDLGLSPEEKLRELREKYEKKRTNASDTLLKGKRPFVQSKSVDTGTTSLNKKDNSKSATEIANKDNEEMSGITVCKSDPNLLTTEEGNGKSKVKDRERRKSLTKLIADFFGKKKDVTKSPTNSTSKGFLSRISPRKSKDKPPEKVIRRSSYSEPNTVVTASTPPPIPPLPLNYTESDQDKNDQLDFESDWKDNSCDSIDGLNRRSSSKSLRVSKQAQVKRHRMAQEIQRKLEEIEVKTKQLEQRGVIVEKLLRGESTEPDFNADEPDLLKEWFDLMRELTELRRYEKQLSVRAKELELEDRHARLQQELRERLDSDQHKTKDDIKVERNIITEMMDIVSKRDSLVLVLEEDRMRYSEEVRDFEEQMLAKGLKLTPLHKISNH